MDVWGNGHAIADGDMTPDTVDHTDFGSVVINGGVVTRAFSISNTGTGALDLTGTPLVTITGQTDFAVVLDPVTPVPMRDSTTFQVRFAPTAVGLQSATLVIANDDADENPYEFAIRGTGVFLTSDLVLTKTVNPGVASPGQTITYTLEFDNAGVGTAANVLITDSVPISRFSAFGIVGSSGAAITATGSISYVWQVEELSVGEWGVITMTGVLSDPLAAGAFDNAAVITTTTSVTFGVTVTDVGSLADTATVTVSVDADDDPPVADDDAFGVSEDSSDNALDVLDGDTDLDSDALTIFAVGTSNKVGTLVHSDTVITYTPATDFFGTETFTYTVGDGSGGYDTASVVVTVNNVNDAPVAVNDAYTTTQGVPLTVPAPGVLGNDDDVDDDSLAAVLDSGPTNGALTPDVDGSMIYTPAPGFSGTDTFTYHSHDGIVGSNVATVEIVVEESGTYTVFLPLVQRSRGATMRDLKR